MKTLTVRISEDLRAQLDIIAQLNDPTVTDEIRYALEAWVEKSKTDPSVLRHAGIVRAEIERDRRHLLPARVKAATDRDTARDRGGQAAGAVSAHSG